MKPRVGISSCLLGENVRYDGGNKRDAFATGPLAAAVTLVPVCPEVEAGMGVPREPVRLERAGRTVRMLGVESRTDHTAKMTAYAEARIAALESLDLSGYVFKKNSPSCGPQGVPVKGSLRTGRGLFAAALCDRWPLLPAVDESDLTDGTGQQDFLDRVFAYRRLRDAFAGRWTPGSIVRFHSGEKLLLMAHEPEGYRELGRLVARIQGSDRSSFAARYQTRFMKAMSRPTTKGRHVNVLQHMAGYFDKDPALLRSIEGYRRRELSLDEVRALILRGAEKRGISYLLDQQYLRHEVGSHPPDQLKHPDRHGIDD